MINFKQSVIDIVKGIPRGKTMSYKDVANKAGSPKAARAVANLMSHNYDESIPCHRVIHTDGTVGNYNRGGQKQKNRLLQAEGAI